MRLFIATRIQADAAVRAINRFQNRLKGDGWRGSYVRAGALHLTYRFLGEVEAVRVPAFIDRLKTVRRAPFGWTLERVGCFSDARGTPRVIWLGADAAPPALLALAQDIGRAIAPLWSPTDRPRPLSPHLTLLRVKPPFPAAALPAWTQLRIPVADFELISSRLSPGGAEYETLERFLLLDA